MVGFLVYGVSQISWSGSGISNDLFAKYTAPKVEWSRYLNGTSLTIFMMVNVVLGLVLLDMYLGKKKKQAKV